MHIIHAYNYERKIKFHKTSALQMLPVTAIWRIVLRFNLYYFHSMGSSTAYGWAAMLIQSVCPRSVLTDSWLTTPALEWVFWSNHEVSYFASTPFYSFDSTQTDHTRDIKNRLRRITIDETIFFHRKTQNREKNCKKKRNKTTTRHQSAVHTWRKYIK